MKIIDNKNLLKESTLEEEVSSLLEELGDAAAKPEGAVVDKEPELEKVDATVKAVEGDLKDDHAEEADEVSEVIVKEGDEELEPEDKDDDDKKLLLEPDNEQADKDGDDELEKADTSDDKDDNKEEELEKADDKDDDKDGEDELEKADKSDDKDDDDDDDHPVDESFSPLFTLLDTLNEEISALSGEAAAKPEATKEGEGKEVDADAAAKAAKEHNECGEKAGEEVKEVEIKESADGEAAAKPEGAVVDKEPELEKVDATVKAVEGDLKDDHAEEADDVDEVVITEGSFRDSRNKSIMKKIRKSTASLIKQACNDLGISGDKDEFRKILSEDKEVQALAEELSDRLMDLEKKGLDKVNSTAARSAAQKASSNLLSRVKKLYLEYSKGRRHNVIAPIGKEVKAKEKADKEAEEDKAAYRKSIANATTIRTIKGSDGSYAPSSSSKGINAVNNISFRLREEVDGSAAAKPENVVVDKAPELEKVDATVRTVENKLNDDHAENADEVSEVEIKESANGDAAAKPENVTVEKEPETKEAGAVASAVESDLDADHKVSVEDVVEVVVEAARRAKANGRALQEDIVRELKTILKEEDIDVTSMMGVGKDFADKEYDEDAAENSAEMNGSSKEFENYKDIQGDGADAALSAQLKPEDLRESVKYSSLKEACMLDEDYFTTDTYSKDTAESKRAKLTEQVSLLMARESMDPMYDELLKTSLYAQRLEEALISKYGASAARKVAVITESKK